jgi:hypothetical protein
MPNIPRDTNVFEENQDLQQDIQQGVSDASSNFQSLPGLENACS